MIWVTAEDVVAIHSVSFKFLVALMVCVIVLD